MDVDIRWNQSFKQVMNFYTALEVISMN